MSRTPEEIARESMAPGTFNFMERLRGRNMPTEEIAVYLDEDKGYKLHELGRKLNGDAESGVMAATDAKVIKALNAEITKLEAELRESRYVFKLRAIPTRTYTEISEAADLMYPLEYNEVKNPFTGETKKELIVNEDRDTYYTNRLWAESIVSMTAPNGDVADDTIDLEFVAQFRAYAPLDAVMRLSEVILRLRMAVEWMDGLEHEDFLVKS